MRIVVTIVLLSSLCTSAIAEVQEQQRKPKDATQQAPTSNQTQPTESAPQQQPRPLPQVKPGHTPWFKQRKNWEFIAINAGVAAGGGYLLSRDGTGSKVGGGVMIGVSGILLCAAFVRGCTR